MLESNRVKEAKEKAVHAKWAIQGLLKDNKCQCAFFERWHQELEVEEGPFCDEMREGESPRHEIRGDDAMKASRLIYRGKPSDRFIARFAEEVKKEESPVKQS